MFNVSTGNETHHQLNLEKVYALEFLLTGVVSSDCPLPCTTTSFITKKTSNMDYEEGGIWMSFEPTVEVTKTDFVTPTFVTMLSNIGGALGLWLGLGMAQVLQIVLGMVRKIGDLGPRIVQENN